MLFDQPWQDELKIIVKMMRDLSLVDDPQKAAVMYGERLQSTGLFSADARLSVSRRNLQPPWYRITRSTLWKDAIDPWKQTDRLPTYDSGLLGQIMYSSEPVVIDDLPARLDANDPAIEHLRGYKMLVSCPQFEQGEVRNMIVMLCRDANFPLKYLPLIMWMSNLWGRSVHNAVLRREVEKSHRELTAAHAALDRELKIVGKIQQTLLPPRLPSVPGLEIAAYYLTSQRAGGDYYDVFDAGKGKCGILIADVSGHGASAAVIMAITHAIAHLHPGRGVPPGELLTFINRSLVQRYTGNTGSFVTAFYGVYDPADRSLRYSRAGHNPPRLLRRGQIQSLDGRGGTPLGIEEFDYQEETIALRYDDHLLFYTDGVTEARDPSRAMFDLDRLDAALRSSAPGAAPMLEKVLKDLTTFTAGAVVIDDQTLLAVRIKRSASARTPRRRPAARSRRGKSKQ